MNNYEVQGHNMYNHDKFMISQKIVGIFEENPMQFGCIFGTFV